MTSAPTLSPNNIFIGKTGTEPRPTAKSWPWSGLSERQTAWDEADRWQRDNDRLRAERVAAVDAKERAKRDRVAAEADAAALAKQAELARDLEARFLAAGGTLAQFEREKDELVLAAIKAATLAGGRAPSSRGAF